MVSCFPLNILCGLKNYCAYYMLHFWYISSSGEASQHFSWFFVDFISMYFLFCLSRKYITYVVFLYEQHRGCCSFYDLKYLSVLWPKWLTPFRNKRRFMLKLLVCFSFHATLFFSQMNVFDRPGLCRHWELIKEKIKLHKMNNR